MRIVMAGGAVLAVAVSGGCTLHVVAAPALPAADLVTRPALAEYLRATPSPTIVLRVPAPQGQIAQEQKQQGSQTLDDIYNLLEKELVKADFAVRDRGLLDAIVRSGQNLDYPLILARTNAQLILEIVSIKSREFNTAEYVRVDTRKAGTLPAGTFPIQGWRFECKVTLVSTGEIGGIYTIDVAPEQNHFLVRGVNFVNATPAGRPVDATVSGYSLTLTDAAQPFVEALIAKLRPR
jgi:hypothetical protein